MSPANPADIADLVDALDAPDPTRRQKAREQLIAAGPDAVATLAANLPLVDRKQQPDILEILADIGSNRAVGPLIEFIEKRRNNPGDAQLRAEALDTLLTVADSSDVDRVFEFLVDIHTDPAPEVRQRVVEGFGLVAGDRARPFIDKALDDDALQVRETAERVQASLDAGETESLGESTLSDRQLIQRLRHRAGSQLEYYRQELLSRDNDFELARRLLEGDNAVPMRALRLMHSIDDPRVRDVARTLADRQTAPGPRAAALRLLADRITSDASDEEVLVIERGLDARDDYVELAAIEAAGRSGDIDLMRRAIGAAVDPDEELSLTAAEALTHGVTSDHGELVDELLSALGRVRDRRRDDATTERVRTEAYLLRALRPLASPKSAHFDAVLDDAVDSLRDAPEHHPILVTGLTLLTALIPEDAPDDRHLPARRLEPIASLADHPNSEVATRVDELLERAGGRT